MKITAKVLSVCMTVFVGTTLLAEPPRGRGGREDWGRGHGRNDDIRLATDIVSLVGASLNILRPPTVYVQPQPVIVSQPQYYVDPVRTVPVPVSVPVQTYVEPVVIVQQPLYVAPMRTMPFYEPRRHNYYNGWRGHSDGRFRPPPRPPRR